VNTGLLIAIIVIVVVVLALAWLLARRARTQRLRKQFGPEYDRAVTDAGSRQAAEHELEDRRTRRQKLEIVPLEVAARDRYLEEWRLVQARFVDSPSEATRSADRLINEVMRERGYPVEDFEQRAADISVDHPQVVDDYRAAHAVAEANERSEASTEDLRQALVHYRSLFEDLLEVDERTASPAAEADRTPDDRATTPVATEAPAAATTRDEVPGAAATRDEATPATARDEGAPAPTRDETAPVTRDEAGTTDGRPTTASTPPQRRSTEEAR
jgi:hypothetical protein